MNYRLLFLFLGLSFSFVVTAQPPDSAVTLQVISAGVEMQRVNTLQWLPVRVEGIASAGDIIRTDATGQVRIVLFEDGTEIDMLPNTILTIGALQADESDFVVETTTLVGQTFHRIKRTLGLESSYIAETPVGILAARGTEFAIRQKEDQQFSFISFENIVSVTTADIDLALESGFGARIEPDGSLSDVVRASSFDELDDHLEGCLAQLFPENNRLISIYIAPDETTSGIGAENLGHFTLLMGTVARTNWFRIPYSGGFGWVTINNMQLDKHCSGLRQFPEDHIENMEDFSELIDETLGSYCIDETPTLSGWEPYIVQANDSISQLAYDFETSERRIQRINCIADISQLFAGQEILLPMDE